MKEATMIMIGVLIGLFFGKIYEAWWQVLLYGSACIGFAIMNERLSQNSGSTTTGGEE